MRYPFWIELTLELYREFGGRLKTTVERTGAVSNFTDVCYETLWCDGVPVAAISSPRREHVRVPGSYGKNLLSMVTGPYETPGPAFNDLRGLVRERVLRIINRP